MSKTLFEHIDAQIATNESKNLFFERADQSLRFIALPPATLQALRTTDSTTRSALLEYAVDKALKELCRINQYLRFDNASRDTLKELYASLLSQLDEASETSYELHEQHILARHHYQGLRQWLESTNPLVRAFAPPQAPTLAPLPCAEYSGAFQAATLGLAQFPIREPVLDIGCGTQARLVHYLREQAIESYGIDRFAPHTAWTTRADWLSFDYGSCCWGTIISNMGFSNHFVHHHNHPEGDVTSYAQTFMKIIRALKAGGSFHYAPQLPFIEAHLDGHRFTITRLNAPHQSVGATIITRR